MIQGLEFEQTGIDYLIVDEAHDYKNLQTVSNIRDAAIDGLQRASDLHMKLEWLRDRHGDRVATMATATPIANSITEAHVMARYLRPDLLQAAGIEDFDAWAGDVPATVTEIEVAPTGGGDYRMHTRFARSRTSPKCSGSGTCSPTSRPPKTSSSPPLISPSAETGSAPRRRC